MGGDVIHPKDVKLFIATPFFGGATYNYVQGVFNLAYNLGKIGVHSHYGSYHYNQKLHHLQLG